MQMPTGSQRSIQSDEFGPGSATSGLLFTLFLMNLGVVPFIVLAVRERSWIFSLIIGTMVLLLIAATVTVIVRVIRHKRMLRRFGDVRLQLSDEDACVGGRFTASLAVPPGMRLVGLVAVLACCRVTHQYKDQKRAEAVWARRPRVPVHDGRIDIAIDIPADLNASVPIAATQEGRRYGVSWEWRLTIEAPEAEEPFCYTYPLTVGEATATPESAESVADCADAKRSYAAQHAPAPASSARRANAAAPTSVAASAMFPDATAGERRTLSSGPLLALVAVNSIPLLGATFLGWRFQEAIALYWAETVIMSVFAALYMLLSHDYTAMIDKFNQDNDRLDLKPVEANTLGQRLSGFLGTALIYGALCGITGLILRAIPGPNNSSIWEGLMQHSGSLWIGVLLIAAYQLSVFLSDYREHMMVRPMYRFCAIYSAMLPLIVAMLISPNGGVIVMLAFVAVKIWWEKKLRESELNKMIEFERNNEKNIQPAPLIQEAMMHTRQGAPAAASLPPRSAPPPTTAPARGKPSPVELIRTSLHRAVLGSKPNEHRKFHDRPLAHYMGIWRLPPDMSQTPGWFERAEFYSESGKLRMRFYDKAGEGDAPDTLERVNVKGTAECIEYIEVRLNSGGLRRILYFSAFGAAPDALELSELRFPRGEGEPAESQTYSLRRQPPGTAPAA